MTLQTDGPGIKIKQPHADLIKTVEGGGSARVIGIVICVGGILLTYSADFRLLDLTFIVGALLAVFGAALVTQRYTMILDRLKGTWSYGGDVFFVIPF